MKNSSKEPIKRENKARALLITLIANNKSTIDKKNAEQLVLNCGNALYISNPETNDELILFRAIYNNQPNILETALGIYLISMTAEEILNLTCKNNFNLVHKLALVGKTVLYDIAKNKLGSNYLFLKLFTSDTYTFDQFYEKEKEAYVQIAKTTRITPLDIIFFYNNTELLTQLKSGHASTKKNSLVLTDDLITKYILGKIETALTKYSGNIARQIKELNSIKKNKVSHVANIDMNYLFDKISMYATCQPLSDAITIANNYLDVETGIMAHTTYSKQALSNKFKHSMKLVMSKENVKYIKSFMWLYCALKIINMDTFTTKENIHSRLVRAQHDSIFTANKVDVLQQFENRQFEIKATLESNRKRSMPLNHTNKNEMWSDIEKEITAQTAIIRDFSDEFLKMIKRHSPGFHTLAIKSIECVLFAYEKITKVLTIEDFEKFSRHGRHQIIDSIVAATMTADDLLNKLKNRINEIMKNTDDPLDLGLKENITTEALEQALSLIYLLKITTIWDIRDNLEEHVKSAEYKTALEKLKSEKKAIIRYIISNDSIKKLAKIIPLITTSKTSDLQSPRVVEFIKNVRRLCVIVNLEHNEYEPKGTISYQLSIDPDYKHILQENKTSLTRKNISTQTEPVKGYTIEIEDASITTHNKQTLCIKVDGVMLEPEISSTESGEITIKLHTLFGDSKKRKAPTSNGAREPIGKSQRLMT
jgi:hypothetical protein